MLGRCAQSGIRIACVSEDRRGRASAHDQADRPEQGKPHGRRHPARLRRTRATDSTELTTRPPPALATAIEHVLATKPAATSCGRRVLLFCHLVASGSNVEVGAPMVSGV